MADSFCSEEFCNGYALCNPAIDRGRARVVGQARKQAASLVALLARLVADLVPEKKPKRFSYYPGFTWSRPSQNQGALRP